MLGAKGPLLRSCWLWVKPCFKDRADLRVKQGMKEMCFICLLGLSRSEKYAKVLYMETTTTTKEETMTTETKMDVFLNGDISRLQYLEIVDEDFAFELDGPCIPVKKILTLAVTDNMVRFAGSMEKEETAQEFFNMIMELDQKVTMQQLKELYLTISEIDAYSSYSTDIIETDLSGVTDDRVWNMIKFTQRQIDRSTEIALKKIEKIIKSENVRLDG